MAYRLELPAPVKVHPVFHISLLEPYKESSIPEKTQPPPPCIEINTHKDYEVGKILDSWRRQGKLEYLIHWRSYDINECMWKPAINVINTPQEI